MVHARLPAAALALALSAFGPMVARAASPVIGPAAGPTDPAKFAWLSDDARKALGDVIAQHKAGAIAAFVFAAGMGGDFWSYKSVAKASDFFSAEDSARTALQTCEFSAGAPCFIVSINGNDVRDAGGGLPRQPSLLADQPYEFDAGRVPFVGVSDEKSLAGYPAEPKAKALVVTSVGNWLWRTGDTVFQAVANGLADCQKTFANDVCILYAVNNRVVYVPGAPQ